MNPWVALFLGVLLGLWGRAVLARRRRPAPAATVSDREASDSLEVRAELERSFAEQRKPAEELTETTNADIRATLRDTSRQHDPGNCPYCRLGTCDRCAGARQVEADERARGVPDAIEADRAERARRGLPAKQVVRAPEVPLDPWRRRGPAKQGPRGT